MEKIFDCTISIFLTLIVKGWYQPYFDRYTQIKLSQGHLLSSIQPPLDILGSVILFSAFAITYCIICLVQRLLASR